MRIIGLTGGIGMGKSTVAAMFRRYGFAIFDADAAVRALQAPHGAALPAIAAAFPGTIRHGVLDRAALRARILADPTAKRRLEAIIHPLVRQAQRRFIETARRRGARAVILDVPLLFETGGDRLTDFTITISAPPALQRARVRARGLSDAEISAIIAKQMPDAEKIRRADAVIRTGLSRHATHRSVRRLFATPAWQRLHGNTCRDSVTHRIGLS
jgi:dephospho-CoA kinase